MNVYRRQAIQSYRDLLNPAYREQEGYPPLTDAKIERYSRRIHIIQGHMK